MTDIQELFCNEYAKDLNASAAALRAGYSENGGRQYASDLLKREDVQDRIAEIRAASVARLEYDIDSVRRELIKVGFFDIRKLVDDLGNPLCVHELDDMTAGAIAGLEIEALKTQAGEESLRSGTVIKYKLSDKLKALELYSKLQGFFERDNAQRQANITLPAAVSAMSTLDRMILKYGVGSEEVKKYTEKYGNASADRPNK